MKTCSKCKQEKIKSEFPKLNLSTCKKCAGEYTKDWQRRNRDKVRQYQKKARSTSRFREQNRLWMDKKRKERRKWIEDYKQTRPCVVCGETDYRCLEFHHVNGRKKGEKNPMEMLTSSIRAIKKAADKCQILCSNCHSRKHYGPRNLTLTPSDEL